MEKVKIKSSKGFISAAIHKPEKETGKLAILCPGLLDEATKIKVPVILVIGELDELIPAEEAKELYDNIKSLKKLIVIPDIGHDYRHNKDEIDIVNKEIEKQLDEIS